ncbi:hypothetical protein K7G90_001781 [Pasteurella canis]|uniref:hypothetical protein n=1 Tax=Pasteurella canis TaxID=753 RepID=UPI0006694766|nr:hypothetical protein [Pasteurella canis]UAY77520.1 hypothetical protein K7G90_001781 [Pasteurella canis]UEA16609.1 hypothetical protein K7G92_001888 [Pasteurella canis]GJJ80021.1 membrane protein [Pasteurella canis]SPY34052.1 Uncharacterised protein [Pasteurella canis]
MRFLKSFFYVALVYLPNVWANADFNIKYSSNYLMPAYVHFKADGSQYSVNAKINVPLYNIQFLSKGKQSSKQFEMIDYKDIRNGNPYATSTIQGDTIEYGKVKNGLTKKALELPTFDLFTMAFQLSYYDKLPINFQITNGKKLYPMHNVFVKKSEDIVKYNKQEVTQITYQFKTGDKDIVVKKFVGEQFPRFISYNRDGDNYELTFSDFVK